MFIQVFIPRHSWDRNVPFQILKQPYLWIKVCQEAPQRYPLGFHPYAPVQNPHLFLSDKALFS